MVNDPLLVHSSKDDEWVSGMAVQFWSGLWNSSREGIPFKELRKTIVGNNYLLINIILAIEVKAQTGTPSELQLAKIDAIRKAGGFAYVVYPSGWEKLKDIIDGLLIDKFNREEDVILKWVVYMR